MKSFEDLTFELLDHKEALDAAIREYDNTVKKMRKKSRVRILYILFMVVVAIGLFVFSVWDIPRFWYKPEILFQPLIWVAIIILIIALFMAQGLFQQQNRFNLEEKRLRIKREALTEQYAEILNQLDKLRNFAQKLQSKRPTAH